jgi:hypothetical protein
MKKKKQLKVYLDEIRVAFRRQNLKVILTWRDSYRHRNYVDGRNKPVVLSTSLILQPFSIPVDHRDHGEKIL